MLYEFNSVKETLKAQYQKDNWTSGIASRTLKPRVEAILKEGEQISVAKAKADAIAYILRNAQIDIHPNEIFADKLNHNNLMINYLASKQSVLKAVQAQDFAKRELLFSATGSFDALMDFGHIAPDWDFLIQNGIVGVINRLEQQQIKATSPESEAFYEQCLTVYRAMIDCLIRMAEVAEKNGTKNNLFMAYNLRKLAVSAPETMAQAMQLTLFFYNVQMHLDATTVRSLGGLDHLYQPLFQKDLDEKRFTEAEQREIIRYFFWKISAMKVIANMPFYIGGTDFTGEDQTSDFTYILLEEYLELDIYDPKIHIMYHNNTPSRLIDIVLESIRNGKNSFVFVNTAVAKAALERIGIEPKDAARLTVYGCYEPAAEGTEVPATCAGRVNMAKAVELALNNGIDPITQEQVGLMTGDDFETYDDFYQAVKSQLAFLTKNCMEIITEYERHYSVVCPSPIMSATYECSVTKGKDLYCGGAKYGNTSIVGLGLATLVDSCAAVKKVIFEEKIITFDELKKDLLNNWQQAEDIQLYVKKNCDKYGNNSSEVDQFAVDLTSFFSELINLRPNGRGGVFRCGMFSVDWCTDFGFATAATPDGRNSSEPISKNICASLGMDKKGVTAFLQSALKLPSYDISDGCVTDVVLHHSSVHDDDGMIAFRGILYAFMKNGGASIHFNVLNPTILREAQQHPERYQNLQIRLCGWNVYFVDLSRDEQNAFILQAENG